MHGLSFCIFSDQALHHRLKTSGQGGLPSPLTPPYQSGALLSVSIAPPQRLSPGNQAPMQASSNRVHQPLQGRDVDLGFVHSTSGVLGLAWPAWIACRARVMAAASNLMISTSINYLSHTQTHIFNIAWGADRSPDLASRTYQSRLDRRQAPANCSENRIMHLPTYLINFSTLYKYSHHNRVSDAQLCTFSCSPMLNAQPWHYRLVKPTAVEILPHVDRFLLFGTVPSPWTRPCSSCSHLPICFASSISLPS